MSNQLRLALSILIDEPQSLDNVEYSCLGYDPYKFGYYGTPSQVELKVRCRDIVFNFLTDLEDRVSHLEGSHDPGIRKSLG